MTDAEAKSLLRRVEALEREVTHLRTEVDAAEERRMAAKYAQDSWFFDGDLRQIAGVARNFGGQGFHAARAYLDLRNRLDRLV